MTDGEKLNKFLIKDKRKYCKVCSLCDKEATYKVKIKDESNYSYKILCGLCDEHYKELKNKYDARGNR